MSFLPSNAGPGISNLSVALASGDALDVRHFSVSERMSALFSLSIVAVSSEHNIDFDSVVGRAARFTVNGGIAGAPLVRSWTGICSELQQISVEEHGASVYQLVIVPSLWLATQRRNHRIFQQMSELEIAVALLEEWGVKPVKRLTDVYKKRKYRVQYGESDFAFISRMLEDAGISFYFESDGEGSRMVLADAPEKASPRALPIPFRSDVSTVRGEWITGVRISRQVRPGKYTIRDHDYRKASSYKLAATASAGTKAVEDELERYHYAPGAFLFESDKGESTPHADDRGKHRADEVDGLTISKRRLEAKRVGSKSCSFTTNAIDLSPGVVMSMLGHPRSDLGDDKPLLIIESSLSGVSHGEWTHHCEAQSADIAHRPPLHTPKPKVSGVESATVVGPKGEEIHTDEFGRVRVHFHWDRDSSMNERSSCWIHVSQSWAGAGFGTTHLPRVGQEVLVDFLGGDPDRPVIVGRVYTNIEKTPYKLPEHKTQSGWKSKSTGKSSGYNEIMFEDLGGRELVRMRAEKDLTKLVQHNESVTIGNDRSKSVGHDDSLSVGNVRSRMVGNNESVTIGSNQSITVGADQTITVGGNQTETITGNRTLTLTGNLTETIVASSTLTQTGDQTVTLTGNRSETICGDMSLVQLGSQTEIQAGSKLLLQLGGETELRLGNETHVQLGSETQVRVGASTHFHAGPQTETVTAIKTINTPIMNVNAAAVAAVKSALIELIASGIVQINGAVVSIGAGSASLIAGGETTIKGSIIKLNC